MGFEMELGLWPLFLPPPFDADFSDPEGGCMASIIPWVRNASADTEISVPLKAICQLKLCYL